MQLIEYKQYVMKLKTGYKLMYTTSVWANLVLIFSKCYIMQWNILQIEIECGFKNRKKNQTLSLSHYCYLDASKLAFNSF